MDSDGPQMSTREPIPQPWTDSLGVPRACKLYSHLPSYITNDNIASQLANLVVGLQLSIWLDDAMSNTVLEANNFVTTAAATVGNVIA